MSARLLALALVAGCAGRAQPYRFSSPLLGAADVPPAWTAVPPDPNARYRRPPPDDTITVERGIHLTPVEDPRPGTIRVASAQAALAVASGVAFSRLPANHRIESDEPHATLHEPSDLRELVGRRDPRDSVTAALAWSAELGAPIDLDLDPAIAPAKASYRTRAAAIITASIANTGKLVAWSAAHDRASSDIAPGSLLVFARTESDDSPDLVAVAIGRDDRGVIEFIFCAGGAIRRGFMDTRHADRRRDAKGDVLNTFLRTGNRWPPKGTHYLSGELLAHVIRTR